MNTKRVYKRVDENVLGQLLNLRVRGASYKRAAEALGRTVSATHQIACLAELAGKSPRELLQLTAKDAYATYRKNVRLAFESRKEKPKVEVACAIDPARARLDEALARFDAAMTEHIPDSRRKIFMRVTEVAIAFVTGVGVASLAILFMLNM